MTGPVYTRDEQVKEIIRCGKDPIYFIKNYAKIQHPTRGTIPFETYEFQDECVRSLTKHRLNIVLKSRQLGLSTVCAAYAVWMAIFQKDKNILVIATKLPTAMNFIKKVSVILQNIPKWLLLPKYEPSKQAIVFSNGSTIKAIPTSDDAGRSEALSLLIVDEAAFIRDFDEIWAGLSPTISTGGDVVILSTPNGVGGQYYRLWTEAVAGQNGFNPIKIMWYQHPDHDQAWFDKETRNLPRKKIAQEYLCVGGQTRIVTTGGFKRAADLRIGDLVLTHKGRFRPVTHVGSRLVSDDEKLFEVSSPGAESTPFIATGNHPALSYRFYANDESALDHLVNNPCDQQWIPLADISAKRKTTDRIINVLFPRMQLPVQSMHRIDMSERGKSVDVNFDLGKLVGLYLARGCNARGEFDTGFYKTELQTHAQWVKQYVEALGCHVNESTSDNGCHWTFDKHISDLLRSFVLGRCAHEKMLDMDRVLTAGPEFIKGLLVGHHAGDGKHVHDKTCVYSTSSQLIYQLRTLNSAFGLYPCIGHVRDNEKKSLHHDTWYLEFQTEGTTYESLLSSGQQYKSGSRTRFVNNGFVGCHSLTDVSHKSRVDGGFTVYDVSVQDDRSFVAESAVLHNCDFIASGDTFLQPDDLQNLKNMILPPIEKTGHDRNVWVWSNPIPGRRYVMSADVARGDAHDYSTFHIIDVEDNEVAVEYMGKVPPEKLTDMMIEWGKKYNNALAVPENNTFGWFVCTKLRDNGYPKLYYHGHRGDPFNYIPIDPETEKPGWPTNQKTRVQVLTKLEELIRNNQLKIYSQRFCDQMQSFVWNGSKPMASKDSYDDLIMSLAIGAWLVEGGTGAAESAAAMSYAILKATCVIRRDKSEMPGNIESAQPLINPNIRGVNANNVYKPVHHGAPGSRSHAISDFSWLYR